MCAAHDLCTFNLDDATYFPEFCKYPLLPQGTNCACDCTLVRNLDRALCPPYPGSHPDAATCAQAKACMQDGFTNMAYCYYIDQGLVCNRQGVNHIPLSSFC
jgi:hypothetical protein